MTFIRIFWQFEDANKDEILTTPLRSAQDDSIGQNDDADEIPRTTLKNDKQGLDPHDSTAFRSG